jgi:hypothetical protein
MPVRLSRAAVLWTLTLLVMGLGCAREESAQENDQEPVGESVSLVSDTLDITSMRFSGKYDSASLGSEGLSGVAGFSSDIDSAVHAASTWSEADQIIRSRLSESSSVPQPLREQLAAHAVFRNHFGALKNKTPSEKELDALGYYTTLLVDNRSPDSWLIQPALNLLSGHWPEERIIAAIDTTLNASRRAYSIDPEGVERHIPDVHSEIRTANQKLTQLRTTLRQE